MTVVNVRSFVRTMQLNNIKLEMDAVGRDLILLDLRA